MKNLRRVWSLVILVLPLIAGAVEPEALAAEERGKVEHMVADARLQTLERSPGARTPDVLLELALAYDERAQYARAVEYYRQAAAQGVGVGELRLGWLYESGLNGEQSYALARSHYERAVAAGIPEANMRLGLLYLDGWGVTRDVVATVRYLQAAANAGYQPAQKILSEMYFSGVGVTTDLKQALAWAEKGAANKDPEAQVLVGDIRKLAARLPQDIRAAREWYQLSVEQDYTAGIRAMAYTFFQPNASVEDFAIGIKWLELAQEDGDALAGFYLAGMHLWNDQLRSLEGSEVKARQYLEISAQGGEMAASEVLELSKEGLSLEEAYRYVKLTPIEDRYIQRLAAHGAANEADPLADAPPRPLKMVQPVYPSALKLANTEGEVVVEFIVDFSGRARDAQVVSTTHQGFADNALVAIKAWRFRPGFRTGRAVNTRVQIKIQFRLSGEGGLDVEYYKREHAGASDSY